MRNVVATLMTLVGLVPVAADAAWNPDVFTGGNPVCNAPSAQATPQSVPDGAGGFIVAWYDSRPSAGGIYAQRVSPDGVMRWTANGVRVSSTGGGTEFEIAPDGAGGVIVAWAEYRGSFVQRDIFAQRLDSLGAKLWSAGDVVVCNDGADQLTPQVVTDGAGGGIISWWDSRDGFFYDLFAQRVLAGGTTSWTSLGTCGFRFAVTAASRFPGDLVPDGAGGAIMTWDQSPGSGGVFAQRLGPTGARLWGTDGVNVGNSTASLRPHTSGTGDGGAIVTYEESAADPSLRAQRVAPNGTNFLWSGGVVVRPAQGVGNGIGSVRLIADGAGGVLVAWFDSRNGTTRPYVQRLTGLGNRVWGTQGVPLSTQPIGFGLGVASDGTGGALVAWGDVRGGFANELFAQRVSVAGGTMWQPDGRPLIRTSVPNFGFAPLVADGAGGAFACWSDARASAGFGDSDLYAQRIDRFGYPGDPAPQIGSVLDVENDEGGFVRVAWTRSHVDTEPAAEVQDYRLWREVPASLLALRTAERGMSADPDEAAASGSLLLMGADASAIAWELVATQAAAALPAYSRVAATTTDSVASGNPLTLFMVEARVGPLASQPHWFSAPAAGYSTDDLAPAMPASFTGTYAGGIAQLDWLANGEPDLAGYHLYRGTTLGFEPKPGNRIATLTDTDFTDPAGAAYVYKLTAVDVHGNESPVATLLPQGAVDVGDTPKAVELGLAGVSPNPMRGAGQVRFALSRAGDAELSVIDVAGREVSVLARGAHAAGEHAVAWDGRDTRGQRLAAGLYFLRLHAEGRVLVRRAVLTD